MNTPVETQGQISSEKICFSYIRFSSRIQAKGDSERRQLEIAPRIAKEKGWILREDLNAADLGYSGYKGSNLKTIQGIIKAAEDGKIPKGSVCILEALDRLTRLPLDDAYQLFRSILKAGIEIYSERSNRHLTAASLNEPFSVMMTVTELEAAFQYSDKLSYRVRSARKQAKAHASDGVIWTKMAPAWLDVDKKNNKFTPNDKADVVRRIFDSYANGKGIRTIMRELNAEKVPPFGKGRQNKGNGWSNSHLRRLLQFRGVIGEYQPCRYEGCKRVPDGAPIPDFYRAIVDKATFYRVQEILTSKTYTDSSGVKVMRVGHASGCKRNATNLFTGLVKCAKCGSSMVIKRSPTQGGKYYYVSLICSNAARGKGCGYFTLQYTWVERAVLTVLWSKVLPVMSENDSRQNELARLEAERKDAAFQIKKWTEQIDKTDNPPEIAMQRLSLWDTRAKALARQIESLSATIDDNPLVDWQQVPNTVENRLRLQTILASEIESLTVNAEKRTATLAIKDPQCTFEMSWPQAKGANQSKKNEASAGFMMLGKQFYYLDQVLVWKSTPELEIRLEPEQVSV